MANETTCSSPPSALALHEAQHARAIASTSRDGDGSDNNNSDDDDDTTSWCVQRRTWHGVPYTQPSGWLLAHAPAVASRHDTAVSPSLHDVRLCVEHVDMLADVYKSHMRCCWPRLLLDTCMAEAAAAAAATTRARGTNASRVRSRAAAYVRQLHEQQCHGVMRAARPRRVVYRNQLAPVLRYGSSDSSSSSSCGHHRRRRRDRDADDADDDMRAYSSNDQDLVYVITGVLHLTRRLHNNNDDDASASAAAAARARASFPLCLVMQPRGRCAAHLLPDPLPLHGRATTTTVSTSRDVDDDSDDSDDDDDATYDGDCSRQLFLLQDVQPCTRDCTSSSDNTTRAAYAATTTMWHAVYASFAWVLTPRGNAWVSRHVCRRRHRPPPPQQQQPEQHAPLRVVLDVFALQHRNEAVRDAVTTRLVQLAVAAADDDDDNDDDKNDDDDDGNIDDKNDGTHDDSTSRARPLLHLRRYALFAHTTAAADVLCRAPHRQRAARRQRLRAQLLHALDAVSSSSTRERDGDDDDEDTWLVYMGSLCSATALPCEACVEAGASYLGAVLPPRTDWPLRLTAHDDATAAAAAAAVVRGRASTAADAVLTRASTLDELADALAQLPS